MAAGWSNADLRLALLSTLCHREQRKHLDVQIEWLLPPIAIVIGRFLLEAQHYLKLHEYSDVEVDGWPDSESVWQLAGSLNIFVFGCLVTHLCPEWAEKLHFHVLWCHMIYQLLRWHAWDKTEEFFERHFQIYKMMNKKNSETILQDMRYFIDEVLPQKRLLRRQQSTFDKTRKLMLEHRRTWRTPMIPIELTQLEGGSWWEVFKEGTKEVAESCGVVWAP